MTITAGDTVINNVVSIAVNTNNIIVVSANTDSTHNITTLSLVDFSVTKEGVVV